MPQAAIVEKDVVAQIEVFQLRERRERVSRQARLVQPHFLEPGHDHPLDDGVFHRDVGLHGLAEHELLEIRRSVEERDRVGHERVGLAVPQPPVQIERLQMRQRWPAEDLVPQSPPAHRHADEIERVNAKVGIRQLVQIGDRRPLAFENDGAAQPQNALRNDPIGR